MEEGLAERGVGTHCSECAQVENSNKDSMLVVPPHNVHDLHPRFAVLNPQTSDMSR